MKSSGQIKLIEIHNNIKILINNYFSYGDQIEVKFKSSIQNAPKHKGFKFEYGISKCDRNRTGLQGRLVHQGFDECWLTITAPINHTIALYFNSFRLGGYDNCDETALQVSFSFKFNYCYWKLLDIYKFLI